MFMAKHRLTHSVGLAAVEGRTPCQQTVFRFAYEELEPVVATECGRTLDSESAHAGRMGAALTASYGKRDGGWPGRASCSYLPPVSGCCGHRSREFASMAILRESGLSARRTPPSLGDPRRRAPSLGPGAQS